MSQSSSSSIRSRRDEELQALPNANVAQQRSLFDKSPAARAARVMYLKIFFGGIFLMVIMLFTIFPIYWGALYKVPARNLKGWVVDFDGGALGQTISQALASNQGASRVTWELLPASRFPGGPNDLANAIKEEKSWAAISINPDATARLTAALQTPDPSYNGAQAITAYAVEARNENAFRSLIRPSIEGSLGAIISRVSQETARRVASSPVLSSILETSPQTIVAPVGFTLDNLIPFDQPVASAATFVGMLYQLIVGFFVVIISYNAREASGLERTLTTKSLIALRMASAFFAYFIISLFYCLLNLAFTLDVTSKFGRSGFLVFWMLNYVGMLAVVLALESLLTLLTPRGMPFFMLLWIISNLSVSLFPIDILPVVFRYGYAAPFYNLSLALRTIVFGTHNRVGRSVGILFAWIAISCITLPLIQWFVRRRQATAAAPPSGAISGAAQTNQEKSPDTTLDCDDQQTMGEEVVKYNGKEQDLRDAVSSETLHASKKTMV